METLEKNPCCSLTTVGPDLTFTEGAWMVKSDYVEYCTSLVRDVLFLLSSQAEEDGIIEELYTRFLSFNADNHCPSADSIKERCTDGVPNSETDRRLKAKAKSAAAAAAVVGEETEDDGMTLDEMAGMFLIHTICLIVSLSGPIFAWWRARRYSEARVVDAPDDIGDEGGSTERACGCENTADLFEEKRKLLMELNKQSQKILEAWEKHSTKTNIE